MTSTDLIPQRIDRTSQLEHGPLDLALRCLTGLNGMLWGYEPHGHKRLAQKPLKIGALRIGAASFNKNVSRSGFQEVFPRTGEQRCVVSAAFGAANICFERSRKCRA